jgi:hypothetical protein
MTGTEIAISAAALEAFAKKVRGRFGRCCVCKKPHAAVVIPVEGIELRVCDHLCAYDLGKLTVEALSS